MKIKKIVCMLLLAQSGFVMAQTETLVTPNGKKVRVHTNPIITANNGLKAESGNIELGGALLKPTTIVTNSENTLTIDGLQVGANTDNVLVADPTGVLKWVTRASLGDNLGNHTATQALNMQYYAINNGGGQWGLRFEKGLNDQFTSDYFKSNYATFEKMYVKVDELPNLKPNDPLEFTPNGFDFVTRNYNGGILRSTSLKEMMDVAQNQYFMPKINLANNVVDNAIADLLTIPYDGQFVYNTNVNMQNGNGIGIYYNSGGIWIPVNAGDNLGDHKATKNLNMGSYLINGDGSSDGGLLFSNSDNAGFENSSLSIGLMPELKLDDPALTANRLPYLVTVVGTGQKLSRTDLKDVLFAAKDNLGDHTATQDLEMSNRNINNAMDIKALGTVAGKKLIADTKIIAPQAQITFGAGAGKIAVSDSDGNLTWTDSSAITIAGDNLGNHIATKDLDMNNRDISNAGNITADDVINANYLTAATKIIAPAVKITNGASTGKIAVSDASGNLTWTDPSAITVAGDNLGNHIATKDLDMNNQNISNAKNITAENITAENITANEEVRATNLTATIKTFTPALRIVNGAGTGKIAVSDASGNLTWTDPSAITVAGDNLGNHIATQDLVMSSKNISGAANVTASGTVTGTNLTATTKTVTPAVQITNGAGTGKIAVSDASGNLVWTNATAEGILISSYTGPLATAVETPYPLNVSTNLLYSNRTITVDKPSRIIITGSLTVAAKSNTMGTGDIIIKQNGTKAVGFGTSLKYSVFNPIMNGLGEIDPNLCLTTRLSFEANVDVEPGTYTFSVDILPTFSAPINTQENYAPEHYSPVPGNYISYKVYNK
ncbi:Collagen triple helix repeat protein [Flavobacterium anhuiense]|uniref:Collagen triple helix repeat protein n=1 Tax=Flavobacterium anhuiense TaxID=459526 RepID=A0A444VXE6_9FLAO|nr:hypothetical protein [Flavobacterium anhuiense]RYJ38224.1 Collagen triple helix repeat protein [Flavobacterium anhuiense]